MLHRTMRITGDMQARQGRFFRLGRSPYRRDGMKFTKPSSDHRYRRAADPQVAAPFAGIKANLQIFYGRDDTSDAG